MEYHALAFILQDWGHCDVIKVRCTKSCYLLWENSKSPKLPNDQKIYNKECFQNSSHWS